MNVTCPECRSVFRVDPLRVPEGGVRARCSVCGGVIQVAGPAQANADFAAPVRPPLFATGSGAAVSAAPAATAVDAPASPMEPTPAPRVSAPMVAPEAEKAVARVSASTPAPVEAMPRPSAPAPLTVEVPPVQASRTSMPARPVAGAVPVEPPADRVSVPALPRAEPVAEVSAPAPEIAAPPVLAAPLAPPAPLTPTVAPPIAAAAPTAPPAPYAAPVWPPAPYVAPPAPAPSVASVAPAPFAAPLAATPKLEPPRIPTIVFPATPRPGSGAGAPVVPPAVPAIPPRSTAPFQTGPLGLPSVPPPLTPLAPRPSALGAPSAPPMMPPVARPPMTAPLAPSAASAAPSAAVPPSPMMPPRAPTPGAFASPVPTAGPRPTAPQAEGRRPINPFLSNDPNQKAKRLARALVSDIVAYHPQKRDEGLKNGTLKQLLREEIKKSYEEYTDQVGKEFAESTSHFQDALNDVLAGGKKLF